MKEIKVITFSNNKQEVIHIEQDKPVHIEMIKKNKNWLFYIDNNNNKIINEYCKYNIGHIIYKYISKIAKTDKHIQDCFNIEREEFEKEFKNKRDAYIEKLYYEGINFMKMLNDKIKINSSIYEYEEKINEKKIKYYVFNNIEEMIKCDYSKETPTLDLFLLSLLLLYHITGNDHDAYFNRLVNRLNKKYCNYLTIITRNLISSAYGLSFNYNELLKDNNYIRDMLAHLDFELIYDKYNINKIKTIWQKLSID